MFNINYKKFSKFAFCLLINIKISEQRYVMMVMESPIMCGPGNDKFDNFFNWTMTYRRDSDFFRPYERLERVGVPNLHNNRQLTVSQLNYPMGNGMVLEFRVCR